MVAEDNKEVKKKRDGKGVNYIYEEEMHGRTGCFVEQGKLHDAYTVNPRTYILYLGTALYFYRIPGRMRFLFAKIMPVRHASRY